MRNKTVVTNHVPLDKDIDIDAVPCNWENLCVTGQFADPQKEKRGVSSRHGGRFLGSRVLFSSLHTSAGSEESLHGLLVR